MEQPMYFSKAALKALADDYAAMDSKLSKLVEGYVKLQLTKPRAREFASQGFPRRDPSSVPADLNRTISRSLCTSMRTTCSAIITPRSSACALLEPGWSCWAPRCSFTDLTMIPSMSLAGMRETDPTDAVFDSPFRCGSGAEERMRITALVA